MKIFLAFVIFFSCAFSAEAHVPVLITQDSPFDITTIEDPELSQAFYGTMNGFPHTYEIVTTKPFHLFTQVLAPDIEGGATTISGIVIKLPESGGRVTEISALNSKDAKWESEYEPFGGDSYLQGPQFEGDLEAGTYHIEVHTPDNQAKYVLVVGKREEMTIGYVELYNRLKEVKQFFGKSPIMIVESPFVYIPVVLIFALGFGVWRFLIRKKKRVTGIAHDDAVVSDEK